MKNLAKKQSGFTLIELLIVVIIVAILAVVGVPLLQGNVQRAKLTEADTGLSMIRTAMRAYQAEHGDYGVPATVGPNGDFSGIGIRYHTTNNVTVAGDLDGRFFSDDAYGFNPQPAAGATTFCIVADGANSANNADPRTTRRAEEVNGTNGTTLVRAMNHAGHLYNATDCTGTPVN